METTAIIKEYLEKKNIAAACRTETVFIYQAQLAGESRLSGCELQLREMGNDLVLTALLPISVRVKEARGVARWLANLNGSRTQPGFFELDNMAGRIQFRVKMHGPLTDDQLEVGIRYCIEQVEAESDNLVKMVCDESYAVREQEIEAIRKKQAAENEGTQPPAMRALNRFFEVIGLRPAPEVDLRELEEDEDERLTFRAAEKPAAQPAIPEDTDEDDEPEIYVEPMYEEAGSAGEQPAQEEEKSAE